MKPEDGVTGTRCSQLNRSAVSVSNFHVFFFFFDRRKWKVEEKKKEKRSHTLQITACLPRDGRMIMSACHWERPTFSFQPPHGDGGTYQRADTRSGTNSQQSERRRILGFMTIPVRGFFPSTEQMHQLVSRDHGRRRSGPARSSCRRSSSGCGGGWGGVGRWRGDEERGVRKIGILTCVIDTRVCPRGIHICRDLNGGL